jgi:hypothetical protein
VPPTPVRGDGLAVAALVLGILGVIVAAVPLAIVSLARTRSGARRGAGLATAALAVSAVWALAAAAVVAALIASHPQGLVAAATTPSPSASPSAEPTSAGTEIGFAELRVGDCIESRPGLSADSLLRVPCTLPHEMELAAIPSLGGGRWPGDQTLQIRGDRLCTAAFRSYVGTPFDRSQLGLVWYWPDEEAWGQGHHTGDCFILGPSAKTTGTLRGSRR